MNKPVLLCLHGWGGTKESFAELRTALGDDAVNMLALDLPGFGSEREPDHAWTVDDYAQWVEQREEIKHQESIMILGHSFGGRIALKLATRGNLKIDHLFLCAAAGIRRPRHIKRIAGFTIAKTGSAVFSIPGMRRLRALARKMLYKVLREHDYERASPRMQETHVRVVREDLRPLLGNIRIPTDIFWGTEDRMTPVADAHIMHKGIAGSALHVFEGIRHGVHHHCAQEIATIIRARIT